MGYNPIPERHIKLGMAVNYHRIVGRDECVPMYIASEPWKLGHGEVVVKLDGKAGGVSLMALSKR